MSETGTLELPRAMREAVGLIPGGEVEITESAGRLIVAPVPTVTPEEGPKRRLTMQEFLAMQLPYDGPPITDDRMHRAIDDEARKMWETFERQLADDADD